MGDFYASIGNTIDRIQDAIGASSIEDIFAVSPLGEEESLRRIYALVLAGVLDIEEPGKKRERLPSSDADETRNMIEEELVCAIGEGPEHIQRGAYDTIRAGLDAEEK